MTSVYSNTSPHPRHPVQQLLPSVSPAPADAAREAPLPGSTAAQHPRSQLGAASAFLCGLPPLRKSCVVASLQRVYFKIFLVWRENQQKKWHFESDFHWQEMMRKMKEVYFWYLLSCFLIGWWISCHSIDVPIPWTQPHSRLCCLILSHPLLGVRPGVSPSAPSSSFLMVSSRTRKRR